MHVLDVGCDKDDIFSSCSCYVLVSQGSIIVKDKSVSVILLAGGKGKRMGVSILLSLSRGSFSFELLFVLFGYAYNAMVLSVLYV